jgi:hypothetical protein
MISFPSLICSILQSKLVNFLITQDTSVAPIQFDEFESLVFDEKSIKSIMFCISVIVGTEIIFKNF